MPESKKKDPTITSRQVEESPEYPEGTHPVAPLEDQDFGPGWFEYSDNKNKPHSSTVAQVVEVK